MIEEYKTTKIEAAFEAAFAVQRVQTPRKGPKTWEPIKRELTPWYLDRFSGGPNPEVRRPGIRYADELS